jgi:hypothetical protein
MAVVSIENENIALDNGVFVEFDKDGFFVLSEFSLISKVELGSDILYIHQSCIVDIVG